MVFLFKPIITKANAAKRFLTDIFFLILISDYRRYIKKNKESKTGMN